MARTRHALLAALPFLLATAVHAQTPPAAASPQLSDPQVAHVAVTANSIDIDLAKFARAQSHNRAVWQFAATMIRDHGSVNRRAAALAKKLGVTPTDNAVSQSLQTAAKAAHDSLAGLQGAAFDRAYIEHEIGYHQGVLDAIDKVLVPNTQNAELKKLLTDVRPVVATHLAHAKQLKTRLERSQRTTK
ncbi:MAG TPA: DUF4142 domain-containing protein [Gemmatimonadales bacterium]|nr:DUF4142 domain-containing protein [Gemmatimonadales bacterium]